MPGGPLIVTAFLLCVSSAALGGSGEAGGDPGKGWRDGPVRYLLSRAQYRDFGKLRSVEERRGFVDGFWRGFDPEPSTPHNEFRESYEQLGALADRWFTEGPEPGWRTERGKVLLLLGIPDRVRRDAGGPHRRDRESWTYERRPGGSNPLEVSFFRDGAGRFRLDLDPRPATFPRREVAEAQRQRRLLDQRLRWSGVPLGPAARDQLARALSQGTGELDAQSRSRFARQARSSTLGGSRVAPRQGRDVESPDGFHDEAYFFKAADGTVMTLLALAVAAQRRAAPPAEFSAVAWLIDERGHEPRRVAMLPLVRHAPSTEGRGSLFGGHLYLEPGSYRVRYAVGQSGNGRLMVRSKQLTVPELPRSGLAASSVVPAESFGPAIETHASPFRVGSEQVVPRPGATFRRGEPLRLYLQVYGAVPDAGTGRPAVDVRFRFERALRNRFKRQGRPLRVVGAAGASMGLALPVGDWPTGDYRVLVDCRDRISGARASSEGAFQIVD